MSKIALIYVEAILVIAVVAVPSHYLVGLDWPWAIVLGAVASLVLRRLIDSGPGARFRKLG